MAKLTPAKRRRLAELLARGTPPAIAGPAVGVSPRAAYTARGTTREMPRITDADREHVADLLRQGMSQRAAAAATRHGRHTIAEVAAAIGKGRAKPRRKS